MTEMTGPTRVFLVDDHAVVRRGLASYLDGEDDIDVVGQADGGRSSALSKLAVLANSGELPEVILMDLLMPDLASPLRIEDLETVALHHTSDPEVVIVELLSRVRLAPTDRRLAVRSIQVFRIRDGKIVFFRDYFNPNGLAEALGSLLVRISSAR